MLLGREARCQRTMTGWGSKFKLQPPLSVWQLVKLSSTYPFLGYTLYCVSFVSSRKEAHWSVRFFSLFTVDNGGYVQQSNKQNWTLHSNEDKKPCVATLYTYTKRRTFGKGNNPNVPEQLDLESSFTFKIYSDYACLKVSRETSTTMDSFLEQSRSIQSIYSS